MRVVLVDVKEVSVGVEVVVLLLIQTPVLPLLLLGDPADWGCQLMWEKVKSGKACCQNLLTRGDKVICCKRFSISTVDPKTNININPSLSNGERLNLIYSINTHIFFITIVKARCIQTFFNVSQMDFCPLAISRFGLKATQFNRCTFPCFFGWVLQAVNMLRNGARGGGGGEGEGGLMCKDHAFGRDHHHNY